MKLFTWLGLVCLCALGPLSSSFASSGETRLINGSPADPKEWPSSVYASMNGSRCSATVVGERTLLIAAHCVSNGGKASFSVGPNTYTSTCTHAPDYKSNNTADWALCLVDKPVTGTLYELVNNEASRITVGQELMLTGYGCVNPGGGGGNDGTYRIGKSKVTSLPSGSNNDIVTRSGAALCYGDSGGPAFLIDAATGDRRVVGVNSRGNISTTSYLSSVSTSAAKNFIESWAQKNSQVLCGIHESAKGCRKKDCNPKPIAIAGKSISIPEGNSVSIGGMPILGQSYQWTPTDTLDYATVSAPIATPRQTTRYTVRATNVCGSAENSVLVTVLE